MAKKKSDNTGWTFSDVFWALCLLGVIVFACYSGCSESDDESAFPERPTPARLVNDLANVIDDSKESALEEELLTFARENGPQIVVLTVSDFGGYDKAQYAYEIGHRWGVGAKNENNGAIILVKPKTEESRGSAFIATGYGLEGNLPDITCGNIVDEIMIPRFKENDYTGGIVDGAHAVMQGAMGNDYRQIAQPSSDGETEQIGTEDDVELDFWTVVGILLVIGLSLVIMFLMYWGFWAILGGFFRLIGWSSPESSESGSDSNSSAGFWDSFSSSSDDFDFGGGDFGGGGGGGDW